MAHALTPLEQVGAPRPPQRGGIQQKYVLTEQGRRLLLSTYDGRSETIDLLAQRLGVHRRAVKKWASQLGLTRQKEPRWTDEDIAYLERHLPRKSIADIAEHLGRTKTAVKLRAKRIGINKTLQEGYTLQGLMQGLGITSHHAVRMWMERGWLKGTKRHTERERDVWYFSERAIRDFIKEHPEEIDLRRVEKLWFLDICFSNERGLGALG